MVAQRGGVMQQGLLTSYTEPCVTTVNTTSGHRASVWT